MENNETDELMSLLRRLYVWNIICQDSKYDHFRGVVERFTQIGRYYVNPQSVFETFVSRIDIPDLNDQFTRPNVLAAAVFSPNFDRIFMERRRATGRWFLPEENVVPGRGYIETMIARLHMTGLNYLTYDYLRVRFQFESFFQEDNGTYHRRIFYVPGVEVGGVSEVHN